MPTGRARPPLPRPHRPHPRQGRAAAVKAESEKGDWSFLESVVAGVYTVPGDGCVDYVSVLREVPDYAGWIVIEAEQDPEKAIPIVYAKLGYDNLVRFIAEAGLKR